MWYQVCYSILNMSLNCCNVVTPSLPPPFISPFSSSFPHLFFTLLLLPLSPFPSLPSFLPLSASVLSISSFFPVPSVPFHSPPSSSLPLCLPFLCPSPPSFCSFPFFPPCASLLPSTTAMQCGTLRCSCVSCCTLSFPMSQRMTF